MHEDCQSPQTGNLLNFAIVRELALSWQDLIFSYFNPTPRLNPLRNNSLSWKLPLFCGHGNKLPVTEKARPNEQSFSYSEPFHLTRRRLLQHRSVICSSFLEPLRVFAHYDFLIAGCLHDFVALAQKCWNVEIGLLKVCDHCRPHGFQRNRLGARLIDNDGGWFFRFRVI